MVQVPIIYPPVQERAIATFDAEDIANSTGSVFFFGAKNQSGFYLTEQEVYSDEAATIDSTLSASTNFATILDVDMDVTFNVSRNIKGNLIANIPISMDATGGATPSTFHKVTITVSHFDGSTATQLAQETSTLKRTDETPGPLTPERDQVTNVILAIADTHFKASEILRIHVKVETQGDGANAGTSIAIGHDPKGRTFTDDFYKNLTVTSVMSFLVPFRIDI